MDFIKKSKNENLTPLLNSCQNSNKFTGRDWTLMQRPCIYIWWRDEQCLYVGKSENGISRPVSSDHHAINVRDEVWPCDEFEVYYLSATQLKKQTLIEIETEVIKLLSPRYNIQQNNAYKYNFLPENIKYEKQTTEDMRQSAVQKRIRDKAALADVLFGEVPDAPLLEHSCSRKGDFEHANNTESELRERLDKVRNKIKLLEKFSKL